MSYKYYAHFQVGYFHLGIRSAIVQKLVLLSYFIPLLRMPRRLDSTFHPGFQVTGAADICTDARDLYFAIMRVTGRE